LRQRQDKGSVFQFWTKTGLLSEQVKLIWEKENEIVLTGFLLKLTIAGTVMFRIPAKFPVSPGVDHRFRSLENGRSPAFASNTDFIWIKTLT
jgi:hypothetical protein